MKTENIVTFCQNVQNCIRNIEPTHKVSGCVFAKTHENVCFVRSFFDNHHEVETTLYVVRKKNNVLEHKILKTSAVHLRIDTFTITDDTVHVFLSYISKNGAIEKENITVHW